MAEFIETYTVDEVAQALKLHPYTIRRLSREKKIPAFKVGDQCLSAEALAEAERFPACRQAGMLRR